VNLNLSQITGKLSPRGWLAVGGAAMVGVLFVYLLMSLASAPSYTTVLAGVNPAQTGKITDALATAGIPYELQNGGTAIAVETAKQAQARVALASNGLLSGTGTSSPLSLGSSSLGESTFQQQVGYQSALERQLDGAIDNFQGVNSTQVQLVLPNPSTELFASSATPASAAVLLDTTQQPSATTVRAIAQMIADSVPSLSTAKVTITDQNGDLLWPTSASASGSSSLLAAQQAEQTYDQQEAASVDAMLASTLGAGKAQVQINAQLDTNETTEDSVTYANKGVPLTSTTSQETLSGSAAAAGGGGAGTTQTQIPSYAATASSGPSKYANKTNATQWGVDKTIAHTVITPGQLTHQSVSVLVANTVPAPELSSIERAVENATGFDAKRGDTISVGRISFAKVPVSTPASSPTAMLADAKYVVIGVGALLFLLFTTRALRRREAAALHQHPTWLRELEGPRSISDIDLDQLEAPTRVSALRSPVNLAKRQVEDLVDREPDRVAAQLRMWMGEE
jgi:flagellar M-ring protein FliF